MSAIRVQGETYENAEDLKAAILELSGQLSDMSDGTPERNALARHIERLEKGYREAVGSEPGQGENSEAREIPPEPAADGGEPAPVDTEEAETEADMESGHFCPVCGQELDHEMPVPLDPNKEQCPDCKGFGKTLSGSLVPGHAIDNCTACQGQGWKFKSDAPPIHINRVASAAPEWPGAVFDSGSGQWRPPEGESPPWDGARWNGYEGKYE